MKRSPFKMRPALSESQNQLREAYKQSKRSFRSPQRARIKSIRRQYKGIKFASSWELDCYKVLEEREKRGEIKDLNTHQVLGIPIKNEAGAVLRLQIEVDFTFYDIGLKRHVRADSKPPKKLDGQKKDWFLRWNILKHIEPDFVYEIYRMHSTWRDIEI